MESTKKMSFYLTSTEIKKLASYLITTTEWLCLNNCCNNEYEKREKYCLVHDISCRFLFCYKSWMAPFEKRFFIWRLFKNLEREAHPELSYFLEVFKSVKDKCHYH